MEALSSPIAQLAAFPPLEQRCLIEQCGGGRSWQGTSQNVVASRDAGGAIYANAFFCFILGHLAYFFLLRS